MSAPVVSEGWKLVPVEPTEDMIVDGFESSPDPVFSSQEDWEKYEAMSGCQQAAHRARLCYTAMLAAAPPHPDAGSSAEPKSCCFGNEDDFDDALASAIEKRTEAIRLAHANPAGRSVTQLVRDVECLLAHIALFDGAKP